MSKIEISHPDKRRVAPYSSAVACDGWLYVSGQGPVDYINGGKIEGTIQEETQLTLSHVEKILNAAGCTRDDVVKCTCHLSDINDFAAFNEVYMKFFTGIRPARTTVQSVLWSNIKVEIDCVARIPKK